MSASPPIEEESISHDESSFEHSGSDTSLNRPTPLKRGGTVRGKSITGRLSKFEDTTTKSSQKLSVIGASLQDLLEFDGQKRTLPLILKNCLDALRDDEGILQSNTLFREAKEAPAELSVAITDFSSPNLNVNMLRYDSDVTAAILLHWLSSLPEPLCTYSKAPKFAAALSKYHSGDAEKDSRKTSRKLAHVIKSLPPANCNSLHYLFVFLRDLLPHSHTSGLTAEELGKIFGPILYRPAVLSGNKTDTDDEPSMDSAAASAPEAESPLKDTTDENPQIIGERLVVALLHDFSHIFADLTIEDMETIPEEQLAEEVVKGKRKNQMLRSNSGTIDKSSITSMPNAAHRKTMLISASSENVAIAHANSAQSPHSSSSGTPTPVKDSHSTSPPSEIPVKSVLMQPSPVKDGRDSSAPRERPSPSASRSSREEEVGGDKEKEKKGVMTTLRKLGCGKDKKEKSPARGRSASTSVTPTPLAKSGSSPSVPASPQSAALAEVQSPTAVFGMVYESLLVVEGAPAPLLVPNILRDCFEYLQDEARSKEFGVFRESGSFNEKNRLRRAYDNPAVRIDFTGADGFTVAALTKEWLRALPDCLLTEALYKTFKAAVADVDANDEEDSSTTNSAADPAIALQAAVAQLPTARRICLHYIIHFFKHHIVAHQQDNKMSESNVGIVLGPCIHRKEDASPDELMDPCHNLIVTRMLYHYDAIFADWEVPVPPAVNAEIDALTIWKQALDLDRVSSVLDQINRNMAANASATIPEAETPALNKESKESDKESVKEGKEGKEGKEASKDKESKDKESKDKDKESKDKDKKRKGSGLMEMWDRFKEESSGGRRRSSTMQSDTAPFAPGATTTQTPTRAKIGRSSSIKNQPIAAQTETPPRSVTPEPISARSSSAGASMTVITADGTTSSSATAEGGNSPKVSPRGLETKRKTSASNLTVRTLTPVAEGGDGMTVVTTGMGGLPSPVDSPTSFGEPKKRTKRSRIRELSVGSSDSRAEVSASIAGLSAPQTEVWLSENAFADLVSGLKLTTGKQLLSFSKLDLKTEFGLRGVALWNTLHTNEPQDEGNLATQVALLTAKIDELMLKFTGPAALSPSTSTQNALTRTSSVDSASPPPHALLTLAEHQEVDCESTDATKAQDMAIDALLSQQPSNAPSNSSLAEAVAALAISDTSPLRSHPSIAEDDLVQAQDEQGDEERKPSFSDSQSISQLSHSENGSIDEKPEQERKDTATGIEPEAMFGLAPVAPSTNDKSLSLDETQDVHSNPVAEAPKDAIEAEETKISSPHRLPSHEAPTIPSSTASSPSSTSDLALPHESAEKDQKSDDSTIVPSVDASTTDTEESAELLVTKSPKPVSEHVTEDLCPTDEENKTIEPRPALVHSDSFPPQIAILGATPAHSAADLYHSIDATSTDSDDSNPSSVGTPPAEETEAMKLAEDVALGVSHSASSIPSNHSTIDAIDGSSENEASTLTPSEE